MLFFVERRKRRDTRGRIIRLQHLFCVRQSCCGRKAKPFLRKTRKGVHLYLFHFLDVPHVLIQKVYRDVKTANNHMAGSIK